jgi:Rrf2 family transcriptional regulator, iron-sulfur cluster assembly transcription factor
MFSRACEYAIRSMLHIASRGGRGERTSLKVIAESTGSPEAFMAKILQKLVHAGLVNSIKGPGGGFFLSPEKAGDVMLSQIVATIDGENIYKGCALGMPECNAERPCPLHHRFMSVREDLRNMLENTSVKDLSEGLVSGHSFLKPE